MSVDVKCPGNLCMGSPAGVIGGVCLLCLSYASVPLQMAVEADDFDDDDNIHVSPRNVAEVLKALEKFEAEILRLRKENESLLKRLLGGSMYNPAGVAR